MNRRTLRVMVLTTTVALLSTVTIGRVGAVSAPSRAPVSVSDRLADSVPIPIVGAGTGLPLFIGAASAAQPGMVLVTSWNEFVRVVQSPSPSLAAGVFEFFALGGGDAYVLPTVTEDALAFSAALTAVTPVGPTAPPWDLIVIPALGALSPTDWLPTAARMTATAGAAQATALLDPPDETVVLATSGQTAPLINIARALNSAVESPANAMLLSSDLTGIVDPISETQPTVVSGAAVMAALITTADVAVGVWATPAGPAHPVAGLQPVLTVDDTLDGVLAYPGAINSWRVLPGYGSVMWGDHTLHDTDSDPYVTEQRTVSWISRSVESWLPQFVFAPDAAPLWSAVDDGISTFLLGLWKVGALQALTRTEAFSVTVGLGTSMTPQDVADGLLKVSVQAQLAPGVTPVMEFQQQVQPGS